MFLKSLLTVVKIPVLVAGFISLNSSVAYSLRIGPGNYTFINGDLGRTATDFTVTVLNPPPFIDPGPSNGGPQFPGPEGLSGPPGGNVPPVQTITYNSPPGVLPGDSYSHNFPGWPANTQFDVFFSYNSAPFLLDPIIDPISFVDDVGETIVLASIPESSSLTGLISFCFLGALVFSKNKFLSSKK